MWFESFKLAHLPISILVMIALWVSKVLVFSTMCGVTIASFCCILVTMRKSGQLHRFRPRNWKQEFELVKSFFTEDVPAFLRRWAF
ncbi:MAG: hypothetical protein GC185_08130 [Alphaproteobacteria bacterium]|nr:hypothetical protein [Alphaproteobacteria bacterium]